MKHKLSLSLYFAFTLAASTLCSGCFFLVAGSAGTVGANAAANNISLGTQIDDNTLKIKAVDAISRTPGVLTTSNVEVNVYDGIILLLGQVPSENLKQKISDQIAQLEGTRMVYNELTIGPRISYNTYFEDGVVTSRIKTNLIGKVQSMHFKVITENGVVYLMALTTPSEGDTAAEIASKTKGVKKVVKIYSDLSGNHKAPTENVPEGPSTSGQNNSDAHLPVPSL